MVRRILVGAVVVALLVLGAAYTRLVRQPSGRALDVDERLVPAVTVRGQELLEASYHADFKALDAAFQPQQRAAWCGVASSATVLSALRGKRIEQPDIFTLQASLDVLSPFAATISGMTLAELGGLLEANGAEVEAYYAEQQELGIFRDVLRSNLGRPGDYVLINYHRAGLWQEGAGHISPVAAYDEQSQMVLVLDVAAHKYPPVWAPIDDVFDAMDTLDGASGRSRGWLEVRSR